MTSPQPVNQLAEDRKLLLEKFRSRTAKVAASATRTDVPQRTQLSEKQRGIWFIEQMRPGTALYNIATAFAIDGYLSRERIDDAIQLVIARHDALRMRVASSNGTAWAESVSELAAPLQYHDLTTLPADEAETERDQIIAVVSSKAIPLASAPLFRVTVIHMPGASTTICAVFHHIVVDGWSLNIFIREFSKILNGVDLSSKHYSYLAHIADERQKGATIDRERCLAYWKERLGAPLPELQLACDHQRPAILSEKGALFHFEIPQDLILRLPGAAKSHGTTLFSLLLTSFKVFLFRMTRVQDVIVGAPFAGRDRYSTNDVIGFFTNTVALRTVLGAELSFREALHRVTTTMIDAQDNQWLPFDRVVQECAPERSMGRHPIFQNFFALYEAEREETAIDGHLITEFEIDTGTSKFDFSILMTYRHDRLLGAIEYSSDLFNHETIERYAEVFVHVIRQALDNPDQRLNDINVVTQLDRKVIESAATEDHRYRTLRYRTLAAPFEEQVERTPDAIALIAPKVTLTYRELNLRANQLAHELRSKGTAAGQFVGVYIDRSVEMLVALYAVAKAGAAYVPLDPDLPRARLEHLLNDCDAKVVVTAARLLDSIPPGRFTTVLADDPTLAAWSTENLPAVEMAGEAAYLLYTSGSTGLPKGVSFPVDASVAFLKWLADAFPIGVGDTVLLKTPFGFDVSVWELFWPLYQGSALVVSDPGGHRDPAYIMRLMSDHGISVVNFVPSMLQAFLEEAGEATFPSVKWVFCAGEALSAALRDRAKFHIGGKLVNLYGPTETGAVTYHVIERDEEVPTVPIGRPIPQARIYILDDFGAPVPVGVPGELYVGGELCLARGYHKQADLTGERFVSNLEISKGRRLYRTGDFCRFRPDANIEYIGRRDSQIKIRGVRVDLGEIEETLSKLNEIEECAAVVIGEGGSKTLGCFARTSTGSQLTGDKILAFLRSQVQPAAVPSGIRLISNFPKTFNGKLDRKRLTEIWTRDAHKPDRHIQFSNSFTARLAGLYTEILSAPDVSEESNFFDLGGHSLLVLKLAAACEREFGIRPTVPQLFANPKVSDLARILEKPASSACSNLVPLSVDDELPTLVLIHAATGSALPYQALVPYLKDTVSLYAIEISEHHYSTQLPRSVDDFAREYLTAVKTLNKENGLIIGGWSFGGNVAFELSRLLMEADNTPNTTLLIDSWLPDSQTPVSIDGDDTHEALGILTDQGLLPKGMSGTDAERVSLSLKSTLLAFRTYRPTKLRGGVYLLCADSSDLDDFSRDVGYAARMQGWTPWASSVEVIRITGNHYSLLSMEHIESTSMAIKAVVTKTTQLETIQNA